MRVVGLVHVAHFLKRHPECTTEVQALVAELREAQFTKPDEVRNKYPSAKVLDGRNVVFKIRGNKYRLITTFAYHTRLVVVEGLETHAEYDRRTIR
jgi:mRNA interferase HigB